MNIIIDAHFPRKLVLIFREVGFIAFHTLGMPEQNRTTDQQILAFAEEHDCIVMTKDADFVDSYHLYNKPNKAIIGFYR